MAFVAGGMIRTLVAVETQTEKVMVDAATQTWRLGEGGTEGFRIRDPDAAAAIIKWHRTKTIALHIALDGSLR